MATHRVPLSRTEEAFVAMVSEEYRAAAINAEQLKNSRLMVLRQDKNIAANIDLRINPRMGEHPMELEYDTPDIAGPPSAGSRDLASVKSTAPESAEGA